MEGAGIIKIAVIGAESTGKTALCTGLATHYNTMWVPEYAREYFNHSDIYNYTLNDLETIAHRQLETEEELLPRARRFMFCDTNLLTLKIWAVLEFGKVPPFIEEQLALRKYDHYLITNNDIPWQADPQRLNKFSRDLILEMNKKEVVAVGLPYTVIMGAEEQRIKNAIAQLDRIFKTGK